MADEVTTRWLDDLDGQQGVKTVAEHRVHFGCSGFEFDGCTYQIDLTEAHAREFFEFFEQYRKAAVIVPKRNTRGVEHKKQVAKIREWADQNGYVLKSTGPLPDRVKNDFTRATGVPLDF